MQQEKIDIYFAANAKCFPEDKIVLLREKMAAVDDSRYATISSVELKSPTTLLLVSLFVGGLGIDRFMLGDTGMGVLKLLTGGCCGILTIIDWFIIMKKAKEANFNKLISLL